MGAVEKKGKEDRQVWCDYYGGCIQTLDLGVHMLRRKEMGQIVAKKRGGGINRGSGEGGGEAGEEEREREGGRRWGGGMEKEGRWLGMRVG